MKIEIGEIKKLISKKNAEIEKLKNEGLNEEELKLVENEKYTYMAANKGINDVNSAADLEQIDKDILALKGNIEVYEKRKKNHPKLTKILNLYIDICKRTKIRYEEIKSIKQ
ncbi:hypothetical protein [endosymbiont GvMRE of Glomus versiforme]|uniref:hypothetical protein n=1 Tax=endosymbiont GvMRE of Glomus versiforme TaxID=2039283 RepID=UPI0011C400E6|nr:hypothetical protein [endosymbiont GvMRE of Glomus versiforme]